MRGLVLFSVLIVGTWAQDVLVTLPDLGTIQGRTKETFGNLGVPKKPYYNFRNIPFAESVSGPKRFSQPVQLKRAIGTVEQPYDATKSGPLCPQLGLDEATLGQLTEAIVNDLIDTLLIDLELSGLISTESVITLLEDLFEVPVGGLTVAEIINNLLDVDFSVSEDCLHLAVSTPYLPGKDTERADLLPVMFFIYGGGFRAGTQMKMGYERLGDVNDVVLVAINYRLGPLGFMCLDTDSSAGNMGLLDQIVGLEWVRDNIEYFGGDPNQITIFGESAGAASVSLLTLSPSAKVTNPAMTIY
ncbi:carboxylesterase 1E-like [Tigriopus californicus]|uniref:carboxylesterase 1E-like n=1 Tax=Tigriopus californicus TaxID=6832 RepID=UPI0027DA8BEE|nr:carboxylesterase 1E-like [Tigriopus californicus]